VFYAFGFGRAPWGVNAARLCELPVGLPDVTVLGVVDGPIFSLSAPGMHTSAFGCFGFGGSPVAEHRVVLGSEEALGHGLGEEWRSTLAGLLL